MKIGKRLYSILMVGLLLVSQINPNFVMAEELQQEPISEPEAVEETSKQSEIEVQDETPIPEEVIEEETKLSEEEQLPEESLVMENETSEEENPETIVEELPEEPVIPTKEEQPQEIIKEEVENTEVVEVNKPYNEVDYLKRNIDESIDLEAVLVEGEGTNNSALVIQKLDENEEFTLEQLQEISKHLFDDLSSETVKIEGKENEKDKMRIEGFSMRFVDTDETQIQLEKDTKSLLLQVNYKLENDANFPEGGVVFTFPDQFLKDADGNSVGEILFPYEENNSEQAFKLLHEGGNYLLTNQKELNASTRGYFQILINNIEAEKIQEVLPMEGTLEILTKEESIGLKTKEYTLQLPEKEIEEVTEQEETSTVDLSDGALLSEAEVQVLPEAKDEVLLEEKNLAFATKKLMAGPFKAPPVPQPPVTADHITIEKVTIRWVSPSSGSEESAMYDDLRLVPTNDIVPNQQWQLDVAFSGKDEIKAGDLEIVIPAYIWLDRDGNEPGLVTVAVPREGSEGARVDFVWKRVGDNIVVTNTRNLSAATKYMIQGTFRMTSPDPNADPSNFTSTYAHQMVDGVNGITDYISNDLFGVVYVTTPNTGETISMTSNVLKAILDTHVEVANASKTAYDKYAKKYNIYYHHDSGDVPSELLPDHPEDYLYIKWYVDGRATGNQPFTMTVSDTVQDTIYKVEGTTEIPKQVDGLMLGASNTPQGIVKSSDGKTITATIFEGYDTEDIPAYIWTAYKQSDFEGIDASFKVYNDQTITVKGLDDQVVTSKSASASVAVRLPIVWTIKKEWLYNEDKYDTPLDVIKSRQPETLNVWLDNLSTGKEKVFKAVLSDENNWQVEYEDDGVVSNYDAFEHSYEVTRHMHGEDGTSIDIVTGRDDTVYNANGTWYYKYWGYDHKSTKYDEETHTWTFVNDYHEGVIGGGYDNFEVAKKATNHTNSNQKATTDKDLNLLRNGQNSTSINYNVHTGTFCLGHTSEPGARSWEVDKHGKRYVTLELHDYGEYFESRKLRNDEFRMATVTMQLPDIYSWVPSEAGSEDGTWEVAEPVPVSLYARGGDETEWTLYAIMNVDGSITPYNGATVTGKTVNLPEGMNETMETIRTNGARAYLDYNVGVILFPSHDIQEKIEEIFESTDYAKATSFNYVTGRLLDDDKNVLGELERYDRTYLHGRQVKLAVDLDKKTEFIGNDRIIKEMTFLNNITLNQQSNITSLSDFEEYFNDYDIPGSKSGTFYDLLPEGMTVDASTVTIDHGTVKMVDIFDDYKGTGRQLLVVKVDLAENIFERTYKTRDSKTGDDSYPNITSIDSKDSLYGTKATLSFQSLYTYDEAKNRGITNLRNTAAYEADEDVFGNIDRWIGEKDAPTGENHKESLTEVEEHLREAMTNLDKDKNNPNFVYAGSTYRITEADFDGLSSLRKYVQAAGDEVWVDGLDNSVYVYEGGKYNYQIILTSETDTVTKDIILIDSIEYYTPMEILTPGDTSFEVGQIVSKRELDHRNEKLVTEGKTPATAKEVWYWKGYFKSVDVSEMKKLGVDVKVYYSTVPDLDITHDVYNPEHTKEAIPEKLADRTVWSTEVPADPSKVTAVAFDCRKAEDGSDFELGSQQSLIAYMHMQAPTYEQQPDAYGEEGYNDPMNNGWAYNNIYMDITQVDSDGMAHETHSYDHYDYTKVGIYALDIEVQKEWDDKNDNDRVRPDSVTVHLIREGVDTGRSLTLNESNDWHGIFPHVLMYDEDGNRIYYTLNENPVEDYTSKIIYDSQNMTLINSRETEKVNIPFVKRWYSEEPDGWQSAIPSSIKVKLYADGDYTGDTKTVRADANGNWTGVFTGLDKYKDGVEVVYTIEEEPITDFLTTIDQENKVITNTYYPYGDLTVEKKVLNATNKALENKFTYTLTLKDADNESVPNLYHYSITDKNGVEVESGEIGNGGKFTLHDQEKIVVKDLPTGVKYEVKEAPQAGFTITNQVATTGTIRSNEIKEATFENTYHSFGTASFEANKDLTGKDLQRFQFRFEILDSSGQVLRYASNDADGNVHFGDLTYNEADDGKVYTYQVIETNRGKGGFTYDDVIYTAEVRPVDNGDGTMTCTVKYLKEGQKVQTLDFTNKYKAEGELTFKAWKVLENRELIDEEFTFILTDSEGNEISRAKNNEDGTITFPTITYDERDIGKEYDYIMYELKEDDPTVYYSPEEYRVHVAVSDNGDGTLSFAQDVTKFKRTIRIAGSRWPSEDLAPKNPEIDLLPYSLYYLNGRGNYWGVVTYPERTIGEIHFSSDTNYFDKPHTYPIYEIYNDDIFKQEGAEGKEYTQSQIKEMMERYPTQELKDGPITWYNPTFAGVQGEHVLVNSSSVPTGFYIVGGTMNYFNFIIVEREPTDELATPIFTNTLKEGALRVEKRVENPNEADPEQTFKFRVEFEGEGVEAINPEGQSGEISSVNPGNHSTALPTASIQRESLIDKFVGLLRSVTNVVSPFKVVYAEEGDIAEGNFYGLDWRITAARELIIGKEGEVQTFTGDTFVSSGGWWSKHDDYTSARFAGTVVLPETAYGMFKQASQLTTVDLTGLDVSNARSLSSMFDGCSSLTRIDGLNSLDVSNVVNVSNMFSGCSSLREIDLSEFNTGSLINTGNMFKDCSSIFSLDLSGFDTSSASNMEYMFSGCSSLREVKLGLRFHKWTSIGSLPTAPISWPYNGGWMKEGDDGSIGTKSSLDLQYEYPDNIEAWTGTWVWAIAPTAVYDSSDKSLKFYNSTTTKTFTPTSTQTVYSVDDYSAESNGSQFNHSRSPWRTHSDIQSVEVVDYGIKPITTAGWFIGLKNLESVNVSKLDTSRTRHMQNMFSGVSKLKTLDLSAWDTPSLESVYWMFNGMEALESLDISGFDSSKINYFEKAFPLIGQYSKAVLEKVILGEKWTKWGMDGLLLTPPTGKTTGKWIREDGSINGLTPSELATQYVTDPTTYAGTWVWEYAPIAVYDSSDQSLKFYNATTAKTFTPTATQTVYPIDVNREESSYTSHSVSYIPWNSQKENIKSVEVVDTGIAPVSIAGWFFGFNNLETANVSKLDTSRTKYMQNAFGSCWNLKSLDLSSWNTPNLETTHHMFSQNIRMHTLNLANFDTSKVVTFENMFQNNSALSKVTLGPKWTKWSYDGELPTPPTETTTGKWMREDGTIEGLTPSELQLLYPANATAYAGTWVWEPKQINYTIKFYGMGGTGSMPDMTASIEEDYTLPPNKYVYRGHVFREWNTKINGSGTSYPNKGVIPAGTYQADARVELYAQWDNIQGLTKVADGVYEFELQDQMYMNISPLPAGVTYRVYEETPDGWKLVSKENDTGVIKPTETAVAKFLNRYDRGTTSVQFHGVKHLDGKPGDNYTFILKENGTEIDRATSTNGAFEFEQITYDAEGTHYYTVEEVIGTDDTIEYDSHVESIQVNVIDNHDGTMSREVIYDTDGIVFENESKPEYLVGGLTIQKTAVTTEVNKNDTFTFQVTMMNANGLPHTEDVTYFIGTTPTTVTPQSGSFTITGVKAGDTIQFSELPKGTTYVITETNLPRGWSMKESRNASGTIVENSTQNAVFNNEYKASGYVRLEAHKKLEGRTLKDGEFTFELQDENGTIIDIQTSGALDANPTTLDDNDQSVSNPWYHTAPVIFDPIEYTQEDIGTHTYKIIEKVGNDSTVIYDESEKLVKVTVEDNGEGFLTTSVEYEGDGALFTNEVITGQLSLRKEIEHYTETASETEFNFVITLKDVEGNVLESSYPYVKKILVEQPVMGIRINDQGEEEYYDTGETQVVEEFVDGTVTSGDTLTLKGSESVVINDLPNGSTYTIEEQCLPGWTLSQSKNPEGTIQAGEIIEALFTNVYSTEGSVYFEATKRLIGQDIIPNTFKFIVKDANGEVVDYAYAKPSGAITFNGIDYTIEDDGKTFYYYITEEEGNEPHIAYDASSKEVMVKVNDNGMGKLECEVTYDENGMEFVNEVGYMLEVSKQVTGEKADPDREFNFTLTLEGLDTHVTYQKFVDGIQRATGTITPEQLPYVFKLTSDDSIVFDRIPNGVTYRVKEEKDDYYTADQEEKTGTIADENVKEAFVNEINWFDVSFDKVNQEGTLIKGATLAIYQEEELIEKWASEETSHTTKLLPGDYVLKEESVSDDKMYVLASDIPFTVNVDGSVTYDEKAVEDAKVIMVDEYTKTSIEVTKAWKDDDNRDGIRPSEVVVHLHANGEDTGLSCTLNEENDWSYIFENLDKYANNELIQYEVTEEAIEPYQVTITKEDYHFLLTNEYEPEKVNIEIEKVWDDEDNRDGVRPKEITITLYGNGEVVERRSITDTMNWKYTFNNLPKKENGKDIRYEVEEEPVTHYDGTVTSEEYRYTITNTHTPGSVALSGTKVWDDGNNQDRIRPTSIVVELYANGNKVEQVEVSEKTGWKFSFNNLPEKENGKEIAYSIQEKPVAQYTTKITGNAKDGYTITNSHKPTIKPTPTPKPSTPKVETPYTGDNTQLGMYVVLLLGALGTILISRKKLKEQ